MWFWILLWLWVEALGPASVRWTPEHVWELPNGTMPIARSILSRPWHYIVMLGASLGTGFWRFPRRYDLDSARQPRNKERETRSARTGSSIAVKAFDPYSGMASGLRRG